MNHRERERKRCSQPFLRYKNLRPIGEGTFGTVYIGEYNGEKYAIKRYTYGKEAIHHTTIREIKALRSFNSKYLLQLIEVAVSNYQVHAVFPFYPDDLGRLLVREALTLADCRDILRQILTGLREIHLLGMVHRDLKPANILIKPRRSANQQSTESTNQAHSLNSTIQVHSSDSTIQVHSPDDPALLCNSNYDACICDFGMARKCGGNMTPEVVTLWYRAPELLLGCTAYGAAADMWSIGCILYEMLKGTPLFNGASDMEQLAMISRLCGPLDRDCMPKCESYPFYSKYKHSEGERKIASLVASTSTKAADLLDKILVLDPEKRLTADECLLHPFFSQDL